MQFLLNVWNRIRKFDPSELSPMQIVVGVAGAIVILWAISTALSFILGILNTIMPFAAGILALYVGYNWLQSRQDDIPEEARKSRRERSVDEALETVRRSQSSTTDDAAVEEQKRDEVLAENATVVVTTAQEGEEDDAAESRMRIEQVVNPETGFKEPDISRLIEEEEAKLAEMDRVNEDVMSQLEARRKRLLGKQDDS